MHITLICAFFARSSKVERILRFFIDQSYKGKLTLLLYNNALYPQKLNIEEELSENKHIILIHNYLDLQTGGQYTNTGDIFRDALTYVPEYTDALMFFDSDDCYLPNHVSESVKGLIKAHHLFKKAYKPAYSYFLYDDKCELSRNNMEPSIIVDFDFVKKTGFHPLPCSYHQKWLDKLREDNLLLDDPAGLPTFLYNWEKEHGDFKISGAGDSPENFKNHRQKELDFGNGILSPCSEESIQKYYNMVYGIQKSI